MPNPTIIHWNCHSFKTPEKHYELNTYINSFSPSIILLNETHLTNQTSTPYFQNYKFISFPHKPNSSGIAIIFHKSLSYTIHQQFQYLSSDSPSSLAIIETCIPSIGNILIGSIYRHPNHTIIENKSAWNQICKIIKQVHQRPIPLLLIGDFNSRHIDFGDSINNSNGNSLSTFVSNNNLDCANIIFCNGKPTHFPDDHKKLPSIADLIITNSIESIEKITILDPINNKSLSDHQPIIIQLLKQHLPIPQPHITHTKWLINENTDWTNFQDHLTNNLSDFIFNFPTLPSSQPQQQINSLWLEFSSLIQLTALATIGKCELKNKTKKWFDNKDVKSKYINMKKAQRKYLKNRSNNNNKIKYNENKQQFKQACKEAKNKLWRDFCNKIQEPDNNKLRWSVWHQSTGSSSKTSLNNIHDSNNNPPSSTTESLNNIGSHFHNTIFNSPPNTNSFHNSILQQFLNFNPNPPHHEPPESDEPLSLAEISEMVHNIKIKTALGPDDISPYFIKYGGPSLFKSLHLLFNFSYTYSVLPPDWTSANGLPLHKKGDECDPNNYRLISITSIIAILFEKLVYKKLIKIINPQLYHLQAGFRNNRSTIDHISFLHLILEHAKSINKHSLPVAFLDLNKAFDSIWLEGLLFKIMNMGVTGKLYKWIKSFISNRTYTIINNNTHSSSFTTSAGVPQGSVLAPLLFAIYINDIIQHIPTHAEDGSWLLYPLLFADDIALIPNPNLDLSQVQFHRLLQSALYGCTSWASLWKMSFNVTKSCLLLFHPIHDYRHNFRFTLHSQPLPRVHQFKYLGITFDENLNWNPHYKQLLSKVAHDSRLICRLINNSNNNPSINTISTLIKMIPLSKIAYGLPIYMLQDDQIKKLQSILARPIRKKLWLPFSTHIQSMLFECNIPTLKTLKQKSTINYYFRLKRILNINNDQLLAKTICNNINKYNSNPATFFSYSSLTNNIIQALASWNINSNDPKIKSKHIASFYKTQRLQLFLNDNTSSSLRFHRHQLHQPIYLFNDPFNIMRARARLRFHRSNLNQHSFHPHIQHVPCPLCDSEPDTVHHLLRCPILIDHYITLCNTLRQHNIIVNHHLLLGNFEQIRKPLREHAREATATFLEAVLLHRNL